MESLAAASNVTAMPGCISPTPMIVSADILNEKKMSAKHEKEMSFIEIVFLWFDFKEMHIHMINYNAQVVASLRRRNFSNCP